MKTRKTDLLSSSPPSETGLLRRTGRIHPLSFAALAALTLLATSASAPAQTNWGNALLLDGVDDYVQAGNVPLANASFTLEAWARRDSATTIDFILGQGTGVTARGLHFGFHGVSAVSNMFVFGFYNDDLFTTSRYTDTDWHHWAGTYEAVTRQRRLYRDGSLVASNVASAHYQGSGPFRIGTSPWSSSGDAFRGQLDEVRIWNEARSQAQVQADMSFPLTGTNSNLVAYWKFDETSGTIAYDATTNHFDGTLVNGPAWTNSTVPPFININAGLPGVDHPSVAWGDYDNDGRLDILLTGTTNYGFGPIAQVWRNTGSGFTNINAKLPGVGWSSAAWGDYDNDGRLDILLTGTTNDSMSGATAQVWRNTGSGFTNINAGLPRVAASSAAWGDYDNDGRLDILLAGWTGSALIAEVWRNTGSGFTNINTGLPGFHDGSVAWGDYDNDGWLDILLTGSTNSDGIVQVWRNTGSGFTNINAGLPRVGWSAAAWGDYDNDGRLDILLTGTGNDGLGIAEVWRNTGSGFTNINAGLPGVFYSSVAWGDYDNDGWLDILLTGTPGDLGISYAQVWRNTGSGFTNIEAGLSGVYSSSVAWGDYDNDGRLDIVLTGYPGSNVIAQVWRNIGSVTNTSPSPPTDLRATVVRPAVTLSWNAAGDGQTPAESLSYNVRVGTTSNGWDIVAPQADVATGFRRLPALGNAQLGLSFEIPSLPWGVYYWSVQAVDGALAGSVFVQGRFAMAVQTLPATEITLTTARLNGTVEPLGFPTAAWFQWGADTNYGQATPVLLQDSGSNPLPISTVLTGLVLHAYHYRVVASNELGVIVGGDVLISMQLERPQVVTLSAANVASTSTTLRGEVNSRERDTTAWFEYGLATKYGAVSAVTNVGRGAVAVPVGIGVSGLLPWMTYHYRAVASNSVGGTRGSDATVTLPGPTTVAPSLSALTDIVIPQGGSTSVWFTVSPGTVNVRVRGNNSVLLPEGALTLGGSGNSRSLSLVPAFNHSGSAQVTVTATDGSRSDIGTFNLTVIPSSAQYHSSLLYLTNAQVVSTQAWRFKLVDAGTGSTNHAVEYRSNLSPTNAWLPATNVTALGGGVFEVAIGPPQPRLGFYRAKGFRLLMAGFDSAAVTVEEGAGAVGAILVFNGACSATVTCIWTDEQGTSWTNQVQVNGTTAVIPIPAACLNDNAAIGRLRHLTLQLQEGAGFALGPATASSVTIEENDAEWQGALQTSNGLLNFTLSLVWTNGRLQGQIRSPGSGFFPTNAPAQLNLTEDTFTLVATNVALPVLTDSPALRFTNYLDLRLDAANSPGQTNVTPTRIQGAATLVSKVPSRGYLDSAVAGTFDLVKPPSAASTNEVPLYPAP